MMIFMGTLTLTYYFKPIIKGVVMNVDKEIETLRAVVYKIDDLAKCRQCKDDEERMLKIKIILDNHFKRGEKNANTETKKE